MIRARRTIKIGAGQTAEVGVIPRVHYADGIARITFPDFDNLAIVVDETDLMDALAKLRATKTTTEEKTNGQ
jgi:hypothetical protein